MLASSLPASRWSFRDRIPHALHRLRENSQDASGFTLIELLMVCLIIGVLAAIAIPAFSSQTGKAVDTQAKELARTAATTAELVATDNSDNYEKVTASELHKYEPSIRTTATTDEAYLSVVTSSKTEYSVTATATNGDEFTISQSGAGQETRSCASPISKTGCKGKETANW